jgi:hypothetical protein
VALVNHAVGVYWALCTGLGGRIKKRFGSLPDVSKLAVEGSGTDASGSKNRKQASELVQNVMGTSGGDNSQLAKKIHARYDAYALCHHHVSLSCKSAVPVFHMRAIQNWKSRKWKASILLSLSDSLSRSFINVATQQCCSCD